MKWFLLNREVRTIIVRNVKSIVMMMIKANGIAAICVYKQGNLVIIVRNFPNCTSKVEKTIMKNNYGEADIVKYLKGEILYCKSKRKYVQVVMYKSNGSYLCRDKYPGSNDLLY